MNGPTSKMIAKTTAAPISVKTINVSRRNKHLFSNPFNAFKLGRGASIMAFDCHMKRVASKITPEHREAQFLCSDPDCGFSCHLNILRKWINKTCLC